MKKFRRFIKNNLFIILAIIYLLWPLDLIPEVFGFLGGPAVYLDDSIILLFAIVQKIVVYMRRIPAADSQQPATKPSDSKDKDEQGMAK